MRRFIGLSFSVFTITLGWGQSKQDVVRQLLAAKAEAGKHTFSGVTTTLVVSRTSQKLPPAEAPDHEERWITRGDQFLRQLPGMQSYDVLWDGERGVIRQPDGPITTSHVNIVVGQTPTTIDLGYRVSFFSAPEQAGRQAWLCDALAVHPPVELTTRPGGKIAILWHLQQVNGVRKTWVEIDPAKGGMIDRIDSMGGDMPPETSEVVDSVRLGNLWLPTKVVGQTGTRLNRSVTVTVTDLKELPTVSLATILLKPGEVVTEQSTGFQFEPDAQGRLQPVSNSNRLKQSWELVGLVVLVGAALGALVRRVVGGRKIRP